MKKLMLLASVLLAFAACKTDKDKDKPAVEAKSTEPAKADDKAKPDPTAKADDTKKDQPAGDLPAECAEYKAAMDKLLGCDKVPQQTRDTLKRAFDAAAGGWTNIPADGKATVAQACKQAIDPVKQAAAACP
jgi:hypothetical protein